MSDVRIINVTNLHGIWADWLLLPNGRLDDTEELANVVKVALLTDRRAGDDDVLPDPDSTDRKGWWGDTDAEAIWDGWQIGTKNWLLERAKITDIGAQEGATVARAENYTRTALRPLIDKRICSRIDVRAERIGLERINVMVTIYRGPSEEIILRFHDLWTGIRES